MKEQVASKGTKHVVRFPRLPIRRFPRRNADDIAIYRRARPIAEVETEAVDATFVRVP
jgi:hypothetical protein